MTARNKRRKLTVHTNAARQDGSHLEGAILTQAAAAADAGTSTVAANLASHEARVDNPHAVTAAQAGAPPTTRQVIAGTGLTGGGDLSADRTVSADFGSGAGKVTEGNDARLSDDRDPNPHTHPQSDITDLVSDLGDIIADIGAVAMDLGLHEADTSNPHAVTAAQVGSPTTAAFNAHKTRHEAGGADELNLAGMLGLLATAQTAKCTVGTWNPVIGGDGGTSGQSYTLQQGFYVKVEMDNATLVWVNCRVVLSAKGTITGNVEIQGFPFAFKGGGVYMGTAPIVWDAMGSVKLNVMAVGNSGLTTARVLAIAATTASMVTSGAIGTSSIGNTTDLSFSMVYSM